MKIRNILHIILISIILVGCTLDAPQIPGESSATQPNPAPESQPTEVTAPETDSQNNVGLSTPPPPPTGTPQSPPN